MAAVVWLQAPAPGPRSDTTAPRTDKPAVAVPDSSLAAPGQAGGQPSETARVVRVVDGDTIDVRFADGRTDRVRYIGVNTWEKWEPPHGSHGAAANAALVGGGEVRLFKDRSDRDKYGRLLRYVYVGDIFVNARLVEEGHAKAKNYPPDSAQAKLFAKLEKQAQERRAGCWRTAELPAAGGAGAPRSGASSPGTRYVGNKSSRKLHALGHAACRNSVAAMSAANKAEFKSLAPAEAAGYRLCGRCPR